MYVSQSDFLLLSHASTHTVVLASNPGLPHTRKKRGKKNKLVLFYLFFREGLGLRLTVVWQDLVYLA